MSDTPRNDLIRMSATLATSALSIMIFVAQDDGDEALVELERGEGREFSSGRDAVEWLHAEEEGV